MSGLGDVGPANTLSTGDIAFLARMTAFEARIAADCAQAGRAHDPKRALQQLRKIHAMLDGIARAPGADI